MIIKEGRKMSDKIHEHYQDLKLGDTSVKILTYENKNQDCSLSNASFTYFHPHQDEVTSLQVTEEIIKKHGGKVISIEHSNPPSRNVDFIVKGKHYAIDPNRMFSKIGIERNLEVSNPEVISAVEKFAAQIADMVFSDLKHNIVFAVHNNYNQNYSIKSYEPGNSLAKNVAKIYVSAEYGSGEFFYVTEERIFDIIKSGGYSVVLQNKAAVVNDGSFSVYTQNNNISYINVEAQRGNYEQQLAMMEFAVTHIL